MSVVEKQKYLRSILLVSAVGILLHVVFNQFVWQGVASPGAFLQWMKRLDLKVTGPSEIWKFAASGGAFAAAYVWLFENPVWKIPFLPLWKIPFLQGWLVRFPNLEGTWVGVLTPRTKAMSPSTPQSPGDQVQCAKSSIPDWARRKGVLPVHLTIKHEFDKLTFTALHPNSTNKTLATQLVYVDQSEETELYVVYFNRPEERSEENAAEHTGCCKLGLINNARTKSAIHLIERDMNHLYHRAKDRKRPVRTVFPRHSKPVILEEWEVREARKY